MPLESTSVVLKTYTGQNLKVLGQLTVDVQYEQQRHSLPLLVVTGTFSITPKFSKRSKSFSIASRNAYGTGRGLKYLGLASGFRVNFA